MDHVITVPGVGDVTVGTRPFGEPTVTLRGQDLAVHSGTVALPTFDGGEVVGTVDASSPTGTPTIAVDGRTFWPRKPEHPIWIQFLTLAPLVAFAVGPSLLSMLVGAGGVTLARAVLTRGWPLGAKIAVLVGIAALAVLAAALVRGRF